MSTVRAAGVAALLLVGLGLSGCAETSSTLVPTGDIDAYIVATGSDGGIEVSARLQQDLTTSIDLDGDDELVASSGNRSVALSGGGSRSARLDVAPAEGTVVTVSLQRSSDQEDAPVSTATLPAPVVITAPSSGSGFDRKRDLRLELGDVRDVVTVSWTGSCVVPVDDTRQATVIGTSVVVQARSVRPVSDGPRRCPVTFVVTRTREGSLDPAYDQGRISGAQKSTITLQLGGAVAPQVLEPAPTPTPVEPAAPAEPALTTAPVDRSGPPWTLLLFVLALGIALGGVGAAVAMTRRR